MTVNDTLDILRGHLTDSTLLNAIAKDLIKAEKEVKAAKVAQPKGKTRLVALVRQDPGSPTLGGAYIVSVPDDDTTNTYAAEGLLNRLRKAAAEHNDAPRPRRGKPKTKVETWDQLFRYVTPKTLKASGSQIGVKAKGNAHELVVLAKETIA